MAIKEITDIYKGYFQKSKVFLHPALGHKRGTNITPIDTYLSWEDKISIQDNKLVCLYYLRDDDDFLSFEEKCLINNPLFEDYKEVPDGKAVYIFNFEEYAEDFSSIAEGKYSKISQFLKTRIKEFYGESSHNYGFIHSYLYPESYFDIYAKILCVDPNDIPSMTDLITEVGELCSLPDMNKEVLKMSIMSLDLKNL